MAHQNGERPTQWEQLQLDVKRSSPWLGQQYRDEKETTPTIGVRAAMQNMSKRAMESLRGQA